MARFLGKNGANWTDRFADAARLLVRFEANERGLGRLKKGTQFRGRRPFSKRNSGRGVGFGLLRFEKTNPMAGWGLGWTKDEAIWLGRPRLEKRS